MTHAEYELALAKARKEPDPMLAAGLTIAASVERLDTIADEAKVALGRVEALCRKTNLAREKTAAQNLDPYAPRESCHGYGTRPSGTDCMTFSPSWPEEP